MYPIFDQCLLLLLSLFSIPILGFSNSYIIGCLLMITEMSFSYYFDKKVFSIGFFCIYSLFAIFFPALFLFMPIILYDILNRDKKIARVFICIYALFVIRCLPLYGILFSAFLLFLACYLCIKSQAFALLKTNQRNTLDEIAHRNELLSEKNKSLLEKQDYELSNAILQERTRIAREIHDNVGHMLSRAILLLGAIKTLNQKGVLDGLLTQLEDTLVLAMNNIRQSVHDLHDESLDLKAVLDNLVDEFLFCPITFDYDISSPLKRTIKYSLISIIKEGLSNIMKHSNATKVSLIVREHPSFYQLLLQDNGTKLPDCTDNQGMGIYNMKERIEQLHGTFVLEQHAGYRIFITIPKDGSMLTNKDSLGGKNESSNY